MTSCTDVQWFTPWRSRVSRFTTEWILNHRFNVKTTVPNGESDLRINGISSGNNVPVRSDCFRSSCCADYRPSDRSTGSHFSWGDPTHNSPTTNKMAEEFADRALRSSIAQLCLPLGWQNANVSALDVSSDVAKRFMLKTGSVAAKFAEIGKPLLRHTVYVP